MTSPQHCEHECVCHQAKSRPKNDCPIDFYRAHGNKTCKCKHDTRSRPAPSQEIPTKHCGNCGEMDCLIKNDPNYFSCWKSPSPEAPK